MTPRTKPPRPRFKVFHGVAELGLGARVARTRGRLVAVTLGVTAAYVAFALLTAGYMRSESQHVMLNVFLISGAMLFALIAAYVQALLAGDLAFPGNWRERVILGQRVEVDEDDELEIAIGKLKDYTLPFYTVLVVLLVLNFLAYGWMTNDFLSEYHTWGYQHTLLRSDDPESQVRGIRNVVNPRNAEAAQAESVRDALVALAADGGTDDEVRGWALWAIGQLRIYEAAPTLRPLLADASASDSWRARTAETLGQLANREAAHQMADLLLDSFGRDELAVGLLRGLGLSAEPETAPEIARLLNVEPPEIRAHAFWALGHSTNSEYRDVLVDYIEDGDVQERCLAAEAMKFLATDEELTLAHTWFATSDMTPCEPVVWRQPYHWGDEDETRMDIVVEETLRAKYLKIVFRAGGERERDFFASVALDEGQPSEIRALARELALRIDHRQ